MQFDLVDKFSTHLKNVLTRALVLVAEEGGAKIDPEHLLWAVGTQKGCVAAELLKKADVKPEALKRLLASEKPTAPPAAAAALSLSEESKRVLEKAVLTANAHGHKYVGTEHLLSALIQTDDKPVSNFFDHERVDLKELQAQLSLVLKNATKFNDLSESVAVEETASTPATTVETAAPETRKTPALDYFGRDLTAPESQERIDPLVGRETEVERVMEILCRRLKNNPLLLGEPGVGKTAIVEGLAARIAAGNVPPALEGKRVVSLDLAMLIAGTMYRGEFEGRLRQVIEEARQDPSIILFIDELHTIVGAGSAAGSLDAANLLKPALARGDLRCIGATTRAEYRKHIESDGALERRFQAVNVEEPDLARTRAILDGLAPRYASFHGVRILPEALDAASRLSARYVHDKRLPDKAIDLLDEAAAAARVRESRTVGQNEERALRQELARVREKKREAVVSERFLEAVQLKKDEEALTARLAKAQETAPRADAAAIGAADVARVLARATGIPEGVLLRQAHETLEGLEGGLKSRVIGQDAAIGCAASALRRAHAGLSPAGRPLASLLFLGPSGVGKTELAKAIAAEAFHDEKALIRLDMSEYSEGFTVSKLLGSPAGYVGYREGAKLTDAVRERPYAVVLFDELEKAHRDVQNLLLQILEEGELTDASGRKVSFRNAVIVITTNVGLERFERAGLGFASDAANESATLEADLRAELRERFRPELINRLDAVCIFSPLAKEALEGVVRRQLAELRERLKARGAELSVDADLPGHLAQRCDAKAGARDVRRLIQDLIENPLSERLSGKGSAKRFAVGLDRGKIRVTQPRG